MDSEKNRAQAISSALELSSDEISMVTNMVVIYDYLDNDGGQKWGWSILPSQGDDATYYLTSLMSKIVEGWMEESVTASRVADNG